MVYKASVDCNGDLRGRNKAETIQNAEAGSIEIPEAFWDDLEPLIQDWDQGHVVKVGKK